MEDKVTITLATPIEHAGQQVGAVTMRKPLVRDLRAAERAAGAGAGNSAVEIALFANLCEVSPDAFGGMDVADYLRVQRAYQGFLSRGSTGAASAS